MKKKMNICRVCLRLDKKLKPVDDKLLEFHDELCEYSVYTLNPLYCLECEHLLRKTYNFKNKCMKAIEIFDDWKKSHENEKKPVEHLSTQLPTSLGLWVRSNTTCLHYEYNEDLNSSARLESCTNDTSHHNIFASDTVKLETECETDLKDNIKIEYSNTKNSNKLNLTHENTIDILEVENNSIKEEYEIKNCTTLNIDHTKELKSEGRTKKKSITKCNEELDTFEDFSDCDVDGDSDDDLTLTALSMKKKKETENRRSTKKTRKSAASKTKKRTACDKPSKRKKVKLEALQFSKERLKSELEAKFEAWGEVRTEDGTVIDKDVILTCLDDKITDDRMKQLWYSIQCENPEPITLRTFKHLIRNFANEDQYTTVFDIEYLNTEDKMLAELQRRQTYECYLKAKYKCDKCFLVFYKPKHLINHLKLHEDTSGNFVCTICKIRYASGKNYRGHVMAHGAVYRCKLCPLVTYYRDSMVNHYNQHQGKAYTCEVCGNVAKSLSGYKRHQYLSHRRGRHVCTACGRAFVSSLGVSLHKKRMHQNEAPPPEGSASVSCPECELTFPSEEVLLKHARTWHQAHKGGKTAGTYNFKRPRTKKPKPPSITCRVIIMNRQLIWIAAMLAVAAAMPNKPDEELVKLSDGVGSRDAQGFVSIAPGAFVSPSAIIGAGSSIETGAVIGAATLGRRVIVRQRAVIEHSVRIADDVIIGQDAVMGQSANIGTGTITELSVVVEAATVGSRVRIGARAVVKAAAIVGDNVVIGSDAVIKAAAFVGDYAVIGSDAVIGAGAHVRPGQVVPPGAVFD